ncbi:hypothetical protein J2754_001598 [Halarchaeum solikamskense]|uniref:hypothetical protein n=1 Tax=Halarchaeum nitratireducens TaxID=489913 RepID=UPI001B3AE6CA|nr:hypothetical protein [Halarchaeum solikamskense]MBP2251277.1 hypothetical protein [Halarchaeum solikamskense]
MNRFTEGDRVRIDIPDETDPDHDRLHNRHGEVVALIRDDAGAETGDPRDSTLYRVDLGNEEVDVRWRDLRPPVEQ